MVIALLPKLDAAIGARVPKVCLVLSVWTCQRKPKLSTQPADLTHCVAVRVVELMQVEKSHQTYSCDGRSRAWVLKPQAIVAVLAVESTRDAVHACTLTLTDASRALLNRTGRLD